MKKYIYIVIAFVGLLGYIGWQINQLKKVKADRDVYKSNTHVLLKDIERYKTENGLNVVSIRELRLKLSELNKYRAGDAKMIESLKIDKKRTQQLTTAQTQTIYELRGNFEDSIVWRERFRDEFLRANASFDSIYRDTLKCLKLNDKWFDLNGCIAPNFKFEGIFTTRDSLLYVEHIEPKRFLFIKWGIKERKQEIVSRNPHTEIINAEFISIRK